MNPHSFVSMYALIGFRWESINKADFCDSTDLDFRAFFYYYYYSFLACLILLKVLRFICMFTRCCFSHYMCIIVTIKIIQTKGKIEWTSKQLIINYGELLKGWLSILSYSFCCQMHGLVL